MLRRTIMAAAGTAALVAATLAPAQAATYAVTVSAPAQADSGALFKVTGKVTGSGAGKKTLKIQRKIGSGPWKTISTVTTTKTGSYTRSVKMASVGQKKYRVVAPAQGRVKQGLSPTRTVTGFTWLTLVGQSHLSRGYTNWDVTARVAETSYPRSVQYATYGSEGDSFDDFNLAGKCDRLRFGLGLDDRSYSESAQSFSVLGFSDFGGFTQYFATDGASSTHERYDKTIAGGITTLRFSASLSGGAVVALTTPKAHCSVSALPTSPIIG